MAASYRPIAATTYEEAKDQLQPGETLVSANTLDRDPKKGHIPVTCRQTFDHGKSYVYARKG